MAHASLCNHSMAMVSGAGTGLAGPQNVGFRLSIAAVPDSPSLPSVQVQRGPTAPASKALAFLQLDKKPRKENSSSSTDKHRREIR